MKGIYKFTNLKNNKVYIGKSTDIERRFQAHKRNHLNSNLAEYNTKFYRALRKYGFESFSFEILEQDMLFTEEELNQKELFYIQFYKSTQDEYGYNIQNGGEQTGVPRKITEEQVLEIKHLLMNSSIAMTEIGEKFQIQTSMVSLINSGKAWNYIGPTDYPLRKNSFEHNKGEQNNNSKITEIEVMDIRKRYVKESLDNIYIDYKDKLSYSGFKKVCYGTSFSHLPYYKKKQKQWILNGTCIDYPRVEEY